jgi:UDP-4-amino-4,6-dideoxy-N-acetyl-beta-L-altrosamine transaminase
MPETALPFLPYGRQSIDEADIAAVATALRSDYLTTGPAVPAFETAFAAAVGAEHAVVCNSGTAALHMALYGVDLQPGQVAIVPAVSFVATANAARYLGADVVFADVDPQTGLMTVDTLQDAVRACGNRRIGAVLPVHLNGWIAPLAEIDAVARAHGAAVIEDSCHALGGFYADADGQGVSIGAARHSAAACFSLHPVKTMTMGEGGILTTADPALAARARLLRSHGITREPDRFLQTDQAFDGDGAVNPWYYEMQVLGFNYRATDFACALGQSQLARLPQFIRRRRELAARYDRLLPSLAPLVRPLPSQAGQQPALHLYVVRIDFAAAGLSRAQVMRGLAGLGIGTQVHYLPIPRQPFYRDLLGEPHCPGADSYYQSCLSLPFFPDMADSDVDRVVIGLARILGLSPADESSSSPEGVTL